MRRKTEQFTAPRELSVSAFSDTGRKNEKINVGFMHLERPHGQEKVSQMRWQNKSI